MRSPERQSTPMMATEDSLSISPKGLIDSPPPMSLASFSPTEMTIPIPQQKTRRFSNQSLRPLDMDELEPLPPSEAQQLSKSENCVNSNPSLHSKSANRSSTTQTRRASRSSIETDSVQGKNGSYSARYVTVSAVLSRSGAAIPLSEIEGGRFSTPYSKEGSSRDRGRKPSNETKRTLHSHPPKLNRSKTFGGSNDLTKRRASNGSALEALGALLLKRDSSGKVSNLSFTKYQQNKDKGSVRKGLSTVSKAWIQGVKEAGAARLGLQMPQQGEAGQTIAQRRARKQGFLFQSFINRLGAEEETEGEDGQRFTRVGTKSWLPTFEVGKPMQRTGHTILSAPPPGPRLIPDLPPDLDLSYDDNLGSSSAPSRSNRDSSIFGIGSAFALNDPPDAPPSPVAMPGAWAIGGPGWNSRSGDWREEGALLLPPPLLDDQGSDAKSFEGLLGVRRMREKERARKQLEKLKARNRPAHKVGMLTALSNFVKAAHAADKASRSVNASTLTRPIDMLSRRHTAPVHATINQMQLQEDRHEVQTITDDDDESQEEVEAEEEEVGISPFSKSAKLPEEELSMRRVSSQSRKSLDSMSRSLGTVYESRALNDNDQDAPPLNGQLSRRSSLGSSRRSIVFENSTPRAPKLLPIHMSITTPNTPLVLDAELDYYHDVARRRDPSAPPTPRLGPTLLSLPPSPWIHSNGDDYQNNYSMLLNMAPIFGPPGTPRLAPTALEIAPSPFPTSPAFSPFSKSPTFSSFASNGRRTSNEITSPFSLSPRRSPTIVATENSRNTAVIRKKRNVDAKTDTRMTPSAMIDIASKLGSKKEDISFFMNKERNVKQNSDLEQKERIARPNKRSFLLWFLFGDLGLGTRSTIAAKASGAPLPIRAKEYSRNYGALLGLAAHIYGFSVFVLAHIVDLGYRIAEFLSMTFWFLRWMILNLTGQTVLARCVIDAYGLVQKEWQTVSTEDHEGKGTKVDRSKTALQTYKGLSRWQVMKGLIELVCLQDVTRERYLEEGAGLEELKGWKNKKGKSKEEMTRQERVDLGAKREADRRAILTLGNDSDSSDEDEDSDEEDDSDDEMVVTRQGPEILEFTKTPKIEHRGYFHQSEDSFPKSHQSSSAAAAIREPKPVEANRLLVKTIKWASRLAISAYGLHVTLVDLPATFTPSGNRFSRQTFAHLSRLHHEDVLHADIQTLDSDAYSPTFYLVRDLSRKVVVVSVRGTQSLQDIIVDLEMVVDQVELSDDRKGSSEKLFCHAGVLRAAKALISRQSMLFKTLSEALEENKDFGIVFTGHSLGGAIASTVVLLLSKYVKEKNGDDSDQGKWVTHEDSGLPAGRSIRAITFAHPATVNAELANRAGKGKVPLVISVVLGSDIIPRCGHGQARELRRVLGGLSRVRKRGGGGDLFHKREGGEEDARVHIVTSWWRWKSIKRKGERATSQEERLVKQIENDLWMLRCDVENDLYAAVKRRSKTNSTTTTTSEDASQGVNGVEDDSKHRLIPPSPWIGPSQRAKAPLHQLASRRQEMDAVTLQNEESISASGILVPAGQSILIYKSSLYQITSPLSFFSLPDFHPRMFAEHFPSAYETALLEDIKL